MHCRVAAVSTPVKIATRRREGTYVSVIAALELVVPSVL
jgi:hypothetical protein